MSYDAAQLLAEAIKIGSARLCLGLLVLSVCIIIAKAIDR